MKLLADKRMIFGIALILIIFTLSFFADFFSPYAIGDRGIEFRLCPISGEHLLGCDLNGADVFTLLLHGGAVSLFVGFSTVIISSVLGTIIGLITGYWGGSVDFIFMRVVDILMAFPGILLALFMTAVMGPSLNNIILAICFTGWIGFARLIRGQVMSLKNFEHVEAARAIGLSDFKIISRHIFPFLSAPLIVHGTFSLSGVIIVESSLSFLGLGPQGQVASWGELLSQGKEVLIEAPSLTLAPGLAIVFTVLALNFVGDALRDYFEP